MFKKFKCIEATSSLTSGAGQVISSNKNIQTVRLYPSITATGNVGTNAKIIKTEPIDYEMLNLEEKDLHDRRIMGDADAELITSSNNASLAHSARYQHVQIQTVPAHQQGGSLDTSDSALHKVILTPREEYVQHASLGGGEGADAGVGGEATTMPQNANEPQKLSLTSAPKHVMDRLSRSPQIQGTSLLVNAGSSSQVIITRTLPATPISAEVHGHTHSTHLQRRHSVSPSHYHRTTLSSTPPPSSLHQPPPSLSLQKQNVRVIRDGRLCEESASTTVLKRRRSISPPPLLHHHSRSAPVSPVVARRYSVSLHEPMQHIDTEQHMIGSKQQHVASMTVQYQRQLSLSPPLLPPPHPSLNTSSISAPSVSGAITISSTTSQQQHQFNTSPTRKCVVTSRHVNVISPVIAAQDQQHYPSQQHSPQHHHSQLHPQLQQQQNVNIQATSSTSPVSAAACPSTPSSSSNDSVQIFRTPDVSSSSSSRNSNLNNIFNTAMRPPPPPPPPKIKNTSPSCSSMSISLGNSNCRNNPSNGSSSGSNSEEPSSSIPDLEFDGTTVLCRVCGDKASGFHYGVHSCEGCKGFFRRSIQQKIQYRPCTKNQQCSILRINRNRCQYCRLKKCIAVGMSRDAVRFGRVPKREKARILAAMQQSTQNRGQQRALATELDDQPRLLAAVLRAHLETCEFTKEKVAAMRQRARECPSYSMPTLLACPLNPAPELQSEQEFSQRFAHVIRGVIDFAGMIPGFQLLTQDDKFTLLKAGLFDALFVRLICMFDSSINSIICLNGQVMRRDAIQNGANARFLVDSTFNFAERMNSMNLSDAEIGLFCAIVLITPDRPGLRNIELIEKMYSRLKGCLQKIINQNRPDQPDFMAKLLDTMPDLRTLSTLHTEKLVVFRTEHKELLRQQMWNMDDEQPQSTKSPGSNWDDTRMDVEAKSPLGSVSSTESGDMDYNTSSTNQAPQHNHTNNHHQVHHPSPLASSTPLLAASLSGTCPLRNRASSGPLGESNADLDIVGSHAHLTQNGLTITPIVRSHSHQQLHHHLTAGTQHRYRKLDSPTDSGIESGNEKNECGSKTVSSGGSSSCSSPRSSVDDALDCTDATAASSSHVTVSVSPVRSPQPAAPTSTSSSAAPTANSPSTLKRQIVEDMPVLKRVLQAPPLYDTNSLMDEAYKPHKKFRALRHRELDTGEADASSTSSNTNGGISATNSATAGIVTNSPEQGADTVLNSPPTTVQTTVSTVLPQKVVSPAVTSPNTLPIVATHQQSQLHMHLTRQTPANTNGSGSILQHQQQQSSTLSSTHSVLAKSLMAEPRMTPEQMKRSDIIQNYIMRDPMPSSSTVASTLLGICTPTGQGNRSPATAHHMAPLHQAHHATTAAHHYIATSSNSSPTSSSSPACLNSTCVSPSTTTVTLASPSPPCGTATATSVTTRWHGHSVITTTSINQRQQSVSPSSNGSSSSSSSGCQYFQSPHSTSVSVSPPRPSPSTLHSPPRLLELQVDIADAQQPLNLSKKSPTPPPNKLQALVAAASAAQRFPAVSADITVTAANAPPPPTVASSANSTQQIQVHKVLLEA